MESSRNENTQGHQVEEIEHGIAILQGNYQEPEDDNVPEEPQEEIEHGIEILQGNYQEPEDDNVPEDPQEEIEDEFSPCSTLIMEPGTSSPTLPDTPSTSDEDFVNIQEASRTPSPSLLQDYEDYDIDEDVVNIHDVVDVGVIKDLNAMVDEDVNIQDVSRTQSPPLLGDYEVEVIEDMNAMLQEYNHGEIPPGPVDEIMPSSSPVSSRTRSAARRRLEANQTESTPVPVSSRTRSSYKRSLDADQTESTPVPSRIKRTRLEKDPSPK